MTRTFIITEEKDEGICEFSGVEEVCWIYTCIVSKRKALRNLLRIPSDTNLSKSEEFSDQMRTESIRNTKKEIIGFFRTRKKRFRDIQFEVVPFKSSKKG